MGTGLALKLRRFKVIVVCTVKLRTYVACFGIEDKAYGSRVMWGWTEVDTEACSNAEPRISKDLISEHGEVTKESIAILNENIIL